MVTTETHQSQDLLALPEDQDQDLDLDLDPGQQQQQQDPDPEQAAALFRFDVEKMGQGPANAITVLTLLDKLVKMLDTVQENQHKMEVHQMEMEDVVKGIQADMSKLSRNHSHTSNTVSKLMDKSRKLSVTMKEVRSRMEQQGMQVKKLEANHAHLINRNNFKVLIFQEETEIPSSVFVSEPPPFPRDGISEEAEESVAGVADGNQSQEAGMTTIDLSSDEDVGLDAELQEEEEAAWPQDLESMESSRAKKLKQSSLKKVDSLKKAFSRQNIEKKMTKIGTKIVSAEQREKIKQRTSSLKVSPLSFSIRKPRSTSDSQPPEDPAQSQAQVQVQTSSVGHDQEVPFTEVHAQLAPGEPCQEEVLGEEQEEVELHAEEEEEVLAGEHGEVQEEPAEEKEPAEEASELEMNLTLQSEGVSEALALSTTLPVDQKEQDD